MKWTNVADCLGEGSRFQTLHTTSEVKTVTLIFSSVARNLKSFTIDLTDVLQSFSCLGLSASLDSFLTFRPTLLINQLSRSKIERYDRYSCMQSTCFRYSRIRVMMTVKRDGRRYVLKKQLNVLSGRYL